MRNFLGMDNFLCFVADDGGVVGAAAGFIAPLYFSPQHLAGEEMFWWSEPGHRCGLALLKALENEAKARGCVFFLMKSLSVLNGERMARVYRRCGYRLSEDIWMKVF